MTELNAVERLQEAIRVLQVLAADPDPAVASEAVDQLSVLDPSQTDFDRIKNAALNTGLATRVRVRATELMGGIVQRSFHG